jgi:hypothetical protein
LLLHLHVVQVHFYCDRREIAIPKVPYSKKSNIVFVAMAGGLAVAQRPLQGQRHEECQQHTRDGRRRGRPVEGCSEEEAEDEVQIREVIEEINVAQLTRAYVADGMSALRPDGTKKSKKRSRKTGRHINTAAWSKIRKLAKGEASGEESGEKDNTADPIATSS